MSVVVAAVIAIYAPQFLVQIFSSGAWGGVTFSALGTTTAMGTTLTGLGVAAVGAVAGFASGAIMTGSLSGALKGAMWGAISAGVAFGIGEGLGHMGGIFTKGVSAGRAFIKAAAHGLSRGIISMAQGGTFKSGFASGFSASFFNPGTSMGGDGAGGFGLRTSISAIVGGTASAIGGGKFSNGAIGAAFVHMFNAENSFREKMIKALGLEKVQEIADRASNIARNIAKRLGLKGAHNGQWDAVRHCIGSCMVAREVGYWKGAIAGDGHEFYDNQINKDTIMDLYNNEVGSELSWLSNQSCGSACTSALQNGYLMEKPLW